MYAFGIGRSSLVPNPAIVARRGFPAFAWTLKLTVPLPVPALKVVAHATRSCTIACHRQPACVETIKVPLPPDAENKPLLVGLKE